MTDERRRDDRVGDAAVDAAWREASGEQPPVGVDAAILAAARAAVRRDVRQPAPASRSRRWTRWQPLAAAAGVIGLSFLLVQMLPRDDFRHRPAAGDPRPAPSAPSSPAREQPVSTARDASPASTQESSAAAAPAAPPPAPLARSPAAAAAGPAAGDATTLPAAERGISAAAPPPAIETAARPSAARAAAPGDWAERIAALHDAGDIAAATAELLDFRAAYPDADAYLPEAVRPWAATIGQDAPP